MESMCLLPDLPLSETPEPLSHRAAAMVLALALTILGTFNSRSAPQNILVWIDGNALSSHSHRVFFCPINSLRRNKPRKTDSFHFLEFFQHKLAQGSCHAYCFSPLSPVCTSRNVKRLGDSGLALLKGRRTLCAPLSLRAQHDMLQYMYSSGYSTVGVSPFSSVHNRICLGHSTLSSHAVWLSFHPKSYPSPDDSLDQPRRAVSIIAQHPRGLIYVNKVAQMHVSTMIQQ